MVESALREAGLEREQVDCLAVALGPGSYAGIRSAIALAQGWQLALGTRTVGVSSVECLAARAQAEKIFGRVGVVIDAQRGEFYLAVYEISAGTFRETEPLRLAARADVDRLAGSIIVGPEAARWPSAGRALFPDAELIGRLAVTRRDFESAAKLEPIYLRETSFVKAPPPRIIPAV
jgi:tRNA threonylcarbamoyl adenosine modification protein YeaZ